MPASATCVAGERSMTERQELVDLSVTAWRKYDSCVRGAVLTAERKWACDRAVEASDALAEHDRATAASMDTEELEAWSSSFEPAELFGRSQFRSLERACGVLLDGLPVSGFVSRRSMTPCAVLVAVWSASTRDAEVAIVQPLPV
jgi:hypothetical protein